MGKLNINNGGVDTNKKMPDIDERFGPYTSVEAANAALGGMGRNTITAGLTVGILTANAGVKEYWYQPNKKSGVLELIPKGGNAADNPTEGNFASFDANGNVVDSSCNEGTFIKGVQKNGEDLTPDADGKVNVTVQDGITPHIDQTTKEWMIGEEHTGVDAEGKSALQIYNDLHPEDTPLTEAEFIKMLKATYPMKYVGYDGAADSYDVGYEFDTLDSKNADSTYEHGLYLMPNADPDDDTPTGSVLFICVNKGENDYKWVKMGYVNIPYNVVTDDRIDDTNLENPAANSVAKASDVVPLKGKLKDVDYDEREYTVENGGIVINAQSYVSGSNGEYNTNTSSAYTYRKTAEINVEGFEKVEFLGVLLKTTSAIWGYAFYAEDEDTSPITGSYGSFDADSSIETISTKIYKLNIPNNAKVLRYTISNTQNTNLDESTLWIKLKKGASITDMINNSVEEIAEDVDAINESLQKREYTVDEDFTIQMDEESEDEEYKGFIRNNGGLYDKEKFRIRIYKGIDSSKAYTISTNYVVGDASGLNLVHYYQDNNHLGYELPWTDSKHLEHYNLNVPNGTNIIKINTRLGSTNEYSLELSEEAGYYDVNEINDSVKKLKGASRKALTVEILSEDNIRIRGRYDDDNDIVMTIGYNNNYKKFRNFLRPRNVYIGSKNYTTEKLLTNAIISHGISDTIGPITMDWCGPIYANHGYSTPSLSFVDLVGTSEGIDNPFITNPEEEIGSIWEDDIDALDGSPYSKRRYIIANITNTKVYLLPVIYLDNDGYPHRDFVYYNSPKDSITIYDLDENGNRQSDGQGGYLTKTTTGLNLTKVADAQGKQGLHIGTTFTGKYSRFDYQVCECKNFMLSIDGLDIQINEVGTYQCNEFRLCYQQICYDASQMQEKFISGWNGTSFTNNYTDVPIQVVFDRQLVFSGSLGFLSYTNTHKMNVLRPFKMGGKFDGNPNGRYLGCAPTAFLKPDNESELNSVTYIPKLKKVWTSQNYNDIDFSKEFNSNTMRTAPQITLNRSTNDLDDINNMSERIYSYIKDDNDVPVFGVGGGHSLVRGVSVNAIKNDMVPENEVFGWWNPPISNKFYAAIMRHGNDSTDNTIVNTDYIGVNEGYFCWYKPQLTDSSTGATIHCFYYKSGNEYIVYIHTKGNHSKDESVILPTLMDGMSVVETIERKNSNIQYLDNIVVTNRLHIACNADEDECNWIVLKVK